MKLIDQITIIPEFLDVALKIIDQNKNEETDKQSMVLETQQKLLANSQKQLENLTGLRLREMIDDQEFERERGRLKKEMVLVNSSLDDKEKQKQNGLELTRKTFEFACYAHKAFYLGDAQLKREILNTLTSIRLNRTLKDRILNVKAVEWLVPIQKFSKPLKTKIGLVEPEKNVDNKGQNTDLATPSPLMCGMGESNSRPQFGKLIFYR